MNFFDISDYISEGAIVIDHSGIIQLYNHKAREIFGLSSFEGKGHKSSSIQKGDFIFIVDTMFSIDDGSLQKEDLEILGLYTIAVEKNQGLMCFGQYMGDSAKSGYRVIKHQNKGIYVLSGKIDDLEYKLIMDTKEKYTSIIINGSEFRMDYIKSIANMVMVRDSEIVFYQSKGYTARKESVKEILKGKTYLEKSPAFRLEPIGKHIYDVHTNDMDMIDFLETAKGKGLSYENRYMEINQTPIMASLIPIDEAGKRMGALLKIEDISNFNEVCKERDDALTKLRELENLYQPKDKFPQIIGVSENIELVKNLAYKASQTDAAALILGASGTGKTYLAKKIHEKSTRKDFPFVSINCAALPRELIESELFGYEKNSFTGSSNKGKKGLVEICNYGTLFFDEIGDMPLHLQIKLLHFLQSKTFFRIGGNEEIWVDVRIICATNKDIEMEVKENRFREDLYYRINVIPIKIDPIRERKEDIAPLVNDIFEKQKNEMGLRDKVISIEALSILMAYDYPGNIREMENIIQRAISLSTGNIIYPKDLMIGCSTERSRISKGTLKELVMKFEKDIILEALRRNKGSAKETYLGLGMGKTNFYKKVKDLEIKL